MRGLPEVDAGLNAEEQVTRDEGLEKGGLRQEDLVDEIEVVRTPWAAQARRFLPEAGASVAAAVAVAEIDLGAEAAMIGAAARWLPPSRAGEAVRGSLRSGGGGGGGCAIQASGQRKAGRSVKLRSLDRSRTRRSMGAIFQGRHRGFPCLARCRARAVMASSDSPRMTTIGAEFAQRGGAGWTEPCGTDGDDAAAAPCRAPAIISRGTRNSGGAQRQNR